MASLGLKTSDFRAVTADVEELYESFKQVPTDGFNGAEVEVESRPAEGIRLRGRIDAVFTDEDGTLVGGEFEFFDHLGLPALLLLDVGEGQRRVNSYSRLYPYGTHESANPLQPGRYRLVLLSPGYAERSVMVELRAGEYEDVDVTLSH